MLTSGTTGTPKGAPRTQPRSLAAVGALLSKVPFRSEETTYVAAPLFHALGFAHAAVAVGLGSTLVIRRRFEPQKTLALVAERRCTALVVVPVMLQRMLALGDEELARHDTSALRIIFVSGSQLEGDLARRAMDRFGDVVYNLYGSTEVAWATIGTPEDLRAAPGCAGRPPFGTRVWLYDAEKRRMEPAGRDRPHLRRQCARRSRATRAAAPRRSSTGSCRPATSATSTRPAACSWTGATTR